MILNIAPPRSGELCFLNKKGFRRHTLFAITIGLTETFFIVFDSTASGGFHSVGNTCQIGINMV